MRRVLAMVGVTFGLVLTAVTLPTPMLSTTPAASASTTPYNSYGPEGTIYRLYRAYFLREPDGAGFHHWLGRYNAGYPLMAISEDFTRSAEFHSDYGNLDNPEFLRLVYNNVLAREPDSAGYAYWVDQMNRGMPRGAVMINFSDSAEFRSKTARGVPPGFHAADPYDFPSNYYRLDGTVPPLDPQCTGLLGVCVGDSFEQVRARLGEPTYASRDYVYGRINATWAFAGEDGDLRIDFDHQDRAAMFEVGATPGSGVRVTLARGVVLNASTMGDVRRNIGEPHAWEHWGDSCRNHWYSYRDARSYDEMGREWEASFGFSTCSYYEPNVDAELMYMFMIIDPGYY